MGCSRSLDVVYRGVQKDAGSIKSVRTYSYYGSDDGGRTFLSDLHCILLNDSHVEEPGVRCKTQARSSGRRPVIELQPPHFHCPASKRATQKDLYQAAMADQYCIFKRLPAGYQAW